MKIGRKWTAAVKSSTAAVAAFLKPFLSSFPDATPHFFSSQSPEDKEETLRDTSLSNRGDQRLPLMHGKVDTLDGLHVTLQNRPTFNSLADVAIDTGFDEVGS